MKFERSNLFWETGPKWRFCLTENFRINLGRGWKGVHEFWDNGVFLARLVDDDLEIFAGFAFNGCSPAWRVFGRWVGTPTPKPVIIPSLVHDVLWQWLDSPCIPWDMKASNDLFWDLMNEEQWRLRRTYHGTVALLGKTFRRFSAKNPNAKCACNHEPTEPTP